MTAEVTLEEETILLPDDLLTLAETPAEPEALPQESAPHRRPNAIAFYFDFLCPFSYRAMLWLTDVRDLLDDDLTDDDHPIEISYHYFSLEQHSRETGAGQPYPTDIWAADPATAVRYGADGTVWRPPRVEETTDDTQLQPPHIGPPPPFLGLLPFIAGEAARRQASHSHDPEGEHAIETFYKAIGALRHEQGLLIWDRDVVEMAVRDAGLDADRFRRDLDDPEIHAAALHRLQRDHIHAKEQYGAFGTPTIVIGDDEPRPVYLKLMPNPTGAAALALYTHLFTAVTAEPTFIQAIIPQTAADKARLAIQTERSQRGLDTYLF